MQAGAQPVSQPPTPNVPPLSVMETRFRRRVHLPSLHEQKKLYPLQGSSNRLQDQDREKQGGHAVRKQPPRFGLRHSDGLTRHY